MATEVENFGLPTKDDFFDRVHAEGYKLTFDDVRLTDWGEISEVDPPDVDLTTRFSRRVDMNTPWVSAAMDTVTEAPMAIAVAKLGGIGVLHAGLSVDQQKSEVQRVVYHLNGRIDNPVTAQESETLQQIVNRLGDRDFRSIPVVDSEGYLRGLLTTPDFTYTRDHAGTRAETAMMGLGRLLTAPADTTIDQAYDMMMEARVSSLPLVEDGRLKGMFVFSDVDRILSGKSKTYNTDADGQLRVAIAVPTREEDALSRIEAMRNHLEVVVLDTAHGDSQYALRTLQAIKAAYPDQLDVMVGNISSPHTAAKLAAAGADAIKVGQGPGSICTTRVETGIGSPQVSAVWLCRQAVAEYGIPVCADGGITSNGDISIAIAAGADTVMMGGMLAGTEEAAGKRKVLEDGRVVIEYRGMGSAAALRDSAAARSRYGTEGATAILPEGVETQIAYKGPVSVVLTAAELALRKSLSYVGAPNIAHHQQHTPLSRITNAGLTESRQRVN